MCVVSVNCNLNVRYEMYENVVKMNVLYKKNVSGNICVCVCVCVCVYIYIYTHTHTRARSHAV